MSRAAQRKGDGMDHYDLIVIGSGPGGGSLAHRLAPTGKRILILERGDYLPRSQDNWSSQAVFVDGKYQATETWHGKNGEVFHPGLHYFVGGNSKVYGAALFRLRERDFEIVHHKDGISPEWPLKYSDFEQYYTEAEKLFAVHGQRGEDPLEPPASGPYPFAPVSHEPRIQELNDSFAAEGLLHPVRCVRRFSLPAERQGGRAGDVRRSGARREPQPDADDQRLCVSPRDRRIRPHRHRRARDAQR
jgi:choline dehydrogenase-like flavoprotein